MAELKTIDGYIAQYPPDIQEKLTSLRKAIREAAPEAQEKMSWQMPTFALYGNLVHFAVHKNHIGFYPAPSGVTAFVEEAAQYEGTKGSLHFPLDKPLPLELVKKIVLFRADENKMLAEEKSSKKKRS